MKYLIKILATYFNKYFLILIKTFFITICLFYFVKIKKVYQIKYS